MYQSDSEFFTSGRYGHALDIIEGMVKEGEDVDYSQYQLKAATAI